MFFSPIELLELATVYFENWLKKLCVRVIIKGITFENVSLWYGASIKYNDKVNNILCVILHTKYC